MNNSRKMIKLISIRLLKWKLKMGNKINKKMIMPNNNKVIVKVNKNLAHIK